VRFSTLLENFIIPLIFTIMTNIVTKSSRYDKNQSNSTKTATKKNGQKIKFLAHSENFKSAKNYFFSYFPPLWAKNMRNFGKFIIQNRQFVVKATKSSHYGPIFQKRFTDYFRFFFM
jgi:hypothetical protein